jgi:hypothetical protein
MKEVREYNFKSRSVIFELIIFLILAVPTTWLLVSSYRHPLVLIFALIPGGLLYLQDYVVRITRQFNKYDDRKKITISDDRSTIAIVQGDKRTEIKDVDVEKVAIFEQKSLGKFGNYSYLVLYTTDSQELLITNFTIPLLVYDRILESFLRKKPRVYYKKTFNYIDEKRFKL